MNQSNQHPLEDSATERLYVEQANGYGQRHRAAAYRRAVLASTGYLPSWLEKKKPGRKPKAAAVPAKA
ncbi:MULTISPECIES: hypothetical protein [unclassified Cupriavidus]|uniref:hypothetical protein n=1 Tax=unclassified Cupriavidus TaxID=2640874 RepID=UPI001C004B3D|nr:MULTISPECIES: hypothetical protein [unclassified Cupriavidus]MCA3184301.1 hypothetical protein [Cupriavidus sp.]MCA3190967.1 hypothetical protein [Cupriavidus sp.]MCA3199311.1 hypothetical protein [Cupriavidus sp.]MCA3204578.1 hypothetical protein [Cupriavidus sp.]MCA3209053.1 hypothetical protein [Cupriavidus sp.]